VAAGRQFDAQFGGDDTGAPVGGIAGDSDFHLGCRRRTFTPEFAGLVMLYHRRQEMKFAV
jgi:hypothetical protein